MNEKYTNNIALYRHFAANHVLRNNADHHIPKGINLILKIAVFSVSCLEVNWPTSKPFILPHETFTLTL